MKSILACTIATCLCLPCLGADLDEDAPKGPALITIGEGYTIHAFHGTARNPRQEQERVSQQVGPGFILMHTDTETGEAKWLARTGETTVQTRRPSVYVSRIIGLTQSDTHLVVMFYESGRLWDRVPRTLNAEKASYRLLVIEKKTGRTVRRHLIDPGESRPAQVPDETIGAGVIMDGDAGFSVFGQPFHIGEDGIAEPDGQE